MQGINRRPGLFQTGGRAVRLLLKNGVERQKDIHRQGLGREENRGKKRAHRDAGLHPRQQDRQGLRAGDKQARQEHARGAEGDPAP